MEHWTSELKLRSSNVRFGNPAGTTKLVRWLSSSIMELSPVRFAGKVKFVSRQSSATSTFRFVTPLVMEHLVSGLKLTSRKLRFVNVLGRAKLTSALDSRSSD